MDKCFVSQVLSTDSRKEEIRKSVCRSLPASHKDSNRHSYCMLHWPSDRKIADFLLNFYDLITRGQTDFRFLYLPDGLAFTTLDKGPLILSQCVISGRASFSGLFKQGLFMQGVKVSEGGSLDFDQAGFEGPLVLDYGQFFGALRIDRSGFLTLTLDAKSVVSNVFEDFHTFAKPNGSLSLDNAFFEHPELVHFSNVRLLPSWFVNVDCRKFVFTNCEWLRSDGRNKRVSDEIEGMDTFPRGIDSPPPPGCIMPPEKIELPGQRSSLFAQSCRRLAENYEINKEFGEASRFRWMANDALRQSNWSGWNILSLRWWYWLSSRYGERPVQALIVLVALIVLFAGYYYFANFSVCPKSMLDLRQCVVRRMDLAEALHQSLMIGFLQNVEYRSTITLAQDIILIFERLIVPTQAALLFLAIRRKFMS